MEINSFKVTKPTFISSKNQWRLIKRDHNDKILERLFYDSKEEADTIYIHLKSEQGAKISAKEISSSEKNKSLAKTEDAKLRVLTAHDTMFDMLISGSARSTIVEKCMVDFNIKRSQALLILKEVLDTVTLFTLSNIDDIVPIHVKRYEDIYSAAEDLGFDKLALKALKAKEQLIGLANDSVEVVINQENFIEEYTFDDIVLSKDESSEFNKIMKKAKI